MSLNQIFSQKFGNSVGMFDGLRRFGIRWVKCTFLGEAISDLRLSSQKDGGVAWVMGRAKSVGRPDTGNELPPGRSLGSAASINGDATFECNPCGTEQMSICCEGHGGSGLACDGRP